MKSQAIPNQLPKQENSLYRAKNIVLPVNSPKAKNTISDREPLNILLIITQGVWGGSQRYVLDLTTELSQKHHVTVAIGEPKGATDLQKKLQILTTAQTPGSLRFVQLKHLQRAISPWHDLLGLFELQSLYRQVNPDVIHLNSTKASILGSLAKLFSPHIPLVYTVHGWIFLEPLSLPIKKLFLWLEKITQPFKNVFITLSPEETEIGKKFLHIPITKIQTIPLGIQVPKTKLSQTQAREYLIQSTTQNITAQKWIGTIAGLYKTKGLDTLIDAIAQEKKLQDSTHYFIIGEGPERIYLESLIEKHQLKDTITLTGHIEEAARLLPAFDLFVLPSKKEGLPYALLETLCFHIPVVATAVGGVPSLLKHVPTAQIVPPGDTKALTEAIQNRLSSPQLPASSDTANQYSLQSMITSTLELYYSLLLDE